MCVEKFKQLNTMASESSDGNWGTHTFRQSMASKIEEAIQLPGVQTTETSSALEDHAYTKAKNGKEYILFITEIQIKFYQIALEYIEQQDSPRVPEAQIPEGKAAEPLEQAGLPSDINERIEHLIHAIENWVL